MPKIEVLSKPAAPGEESSYSYYSSESEPDRVTGLIAYKISSPVEVVADEIASDFEATTKRGKGKGNKKMKSAYDDLSSSNKLKKYQAIVKTRWQRIPSVPSKNP